MSKKKKRQRRPTPAQPSMLLVSYVPLLCGQAGTTYDLRKDADAIQAISRQIGQAPSGKAEVCLWMLDDLNRPGAVPAFERATAIAGHLKEWSENRPAKWFKVYLKEKDGKYALVLFPEIRQSLSRFKFAHLLEGGDPIASGKVQFITNPLRFVSGAGTAYSAIKDRIGKTISVGLVEIGLIDWQNPFGLDQEKIACLGEFVVGDNRYVGGQRTMPVVRDNSGVPLAELLPAHEVSSQAAAVLALDEQFRGWKAEENFQRLQPLETPGSSTRSVRPGIRKSAASAARK